VQDLVGAPVVVVTPVEQLGNAMGVGLYTKAGWASWVGLAHAGMRQLQAGLRGKMEGLHWCVNSKYVGPSDQCRLVVTVEHHAGGVVRVNTAGRKVEGARRGSTW
jgi:hypothetical protein